MLWLAIQAPFAACRPFVAGWYRPTATFLTHSAAYGLVLNLARIESRLWEYQTEHDGAVPASLTRNGLPRVRLALGVPENAAAPSVQTLYQQLHNYPVGASTGLPPELAKYRKNNIQPVRREILCDVRVIVVVDGSEELEADVCLGLRGEQNTGRYGLPFLGDNNFLLDTVEIVSPTRARWYSLVTDQEGGPREGTTRLTTHIGRADMSATRSALFAPEPTASDRPPVSAWVPVGLSEDFDKWLVAQSTRPLAE